MRLSAHEVYDLHELTMSCVNSITSMGAFINQAQDPELKSMLQRHFPLHVKDYNIKVQYLSRSGGVTEHLPVPQIVQNFDPFTQSQMNQYQAVIPRTSVRQFNDREIATSYLLTLKRAGREYAWATMECSNPEIRAFLENAFQMSSHHAFEVWQYMASRGYYPVQSASEQTLSTFSQIYQPVVDQAQGQLMHQTREEFQYIR